MITTRDINPKKDDSKKKLNQKTTRDIDVENLGYGKPLKPATGPMITTHNIEDFQKKAKTAKIRTVKKKKKK